MMTGEATAPPLRGLRVLDIGREVAGPFCARLLARLGADVVKVEPPGRGDSVRRRGPFRPGAALGESGPMHLYVNEGKRGVTLDLHTPTGRDLFLRLVERADAVVENFEPGVMPGLGLSFEAMRAQRPRLILVSISDFGQQGLYREYQGTELIAFAMGGHMSKTGALGRPPLRMGGEPAQYLAAIASAYAAVVALRAAEKSGVGQQVDYSIFESQVTAHAQGMVEVSYYGEETGAQVPRGSMMRGLKARDGITMLSAQEQQQKSLAELVGAPEELGRANPMDRGATRQALNEYVAGWVAERSKYDVYREGQGAHVPTSFVASPEDLLNSPQYRFRQFLREIEHPDAGPITVPGLPFR